MFIFCGMTLHFLLNYETMKGNEEKGCEHMKRGIKEIRVASLPLPIYLIALLLAAVCMAVDSIPANMVGAFFILMMLGEGLSSLGNAIPVVRTFLGGSVVCTLGGAIMAYVGAVPPAVIDTLSVFVNESGFLTL